MPVADELLYSIKHFGLERPLGLELLFNSTGPATQTLESNQLMWALGQYVDDGDGYRIKHHHVSQKDD